MVTSKNNDSLEIKQEKEQDCPLYWINPSKTLIPKTNTFAKNIFMKEVIQYDELPSLGYEMFDNGSIAFLQKTENTPSWLYNSDYLYWTMSPEGDSSNYIWNICETGEVSNVDVFRHVGPKDGSFTVRPVIVLSKSVL